MLIRRKSSTDDEYHHEDPLGNFAVITGANAATLSSNVYDAFMGMQYVQGVSKTTQPATCFKAMSEPNMLTGSGGRGVVVPSRGFQVMGKKPAPAKKHQCTGHPTLDCLNRCLKMGYDWMYCATSCHFLRHAGETRDCNTGERKACDNACRGFGENYKCGLCTYDMDNRRYYYECLKMWFLP